MTNLLLLSTILVLSNACDNERGESESMLGSDDSVADTMSLISPNINDLFGKWINLNQKNGELVIYIPCASRNPEMVVSEDTLKIRWAGDVSDHLIDSIIQKDKNKYTIYARGYIYQNELVHLNNKFQVNVDVIQQQALVVFEWEMDWGDYSLREYNSSLSYRWLMTNASNSSNFSIIDNSCPDRRKHEILMDTVSFEAIKKRYQSH